MFADTVSLGKFSSDFTNIFGLTPQLNNVYFLLQTKTTHVDSEMINITKFDIVTLCATLSEENNVFENNIYLHFVYKIEVFLKQLVTGHPVIKKKKFYENFNFSNLP